MRRASAKSSAGGTELAPTLEPFLEGRAPSRPGSGGASRVARRKSIRDRLKFGPIVISSRVAAFGAGRRSPEGPYPRTGFRRGVESRPDAGGLDWSVDPGLAGTAGVAAARRQAPALRASLVGPRSRRAAEVREGVDFRAGFRRRLRSAGSRQAKRRPGGTCERIPAAGVSPPQGSFRLTPDRPGGPGGCGGALPVGRGVSRPRDDPQVSGSSKKKSRIGVPDERTGRGSRRADRHGILPETRSRWRFGDPILLRSGCGTPRIGRIRPTFPRTCG